MTFEDRHTSPLIAQEIEKQLSSLHLYDKLVSITCDGAANMRQMFNYFTRKNMKFIHCFAHRLHLVICNSLNLWVSVKKKKKAASDEEAQSDTDDQDDPDSQLSEMVRTISFDEDFSSNGSSENEPDDSQVNEISTQFLCDADRPSSRFRE